MVGKSYPVEYSVCPSLQCQQLTASRIIFVPDPIVVSWQLSGRSLLLHRANLTVCSCNLNLTSGHRHHSHSSSTAATGKRTTCKMSQSTDPQLWDSAHIYESTAAVMIHSNRIWPDKYSWSPHGHTNPQLVQDRRTVPCFRIPTSSYILLVTTGDRPPVGIPSWDHPESIHPLMVQNLHFSKNMLKATCSLGYI